MDEPIEKNEPINNPSEEYLTSNTSPVSEHTAPAIEHENTPTPANEASFYKSNIIDVEEPSPKKENIFAKILQSILAFTKNQKALKITLLVILVLFLSSGAVLGYSVVKKNNVLKEKEALIETKTTENQSQAKTIKKLRADLTAALITPTPAPVAPVVTPIPTPRTTTPLRRTVVPTAVQEEVIAPPAPPQ